MERDALIYRLSNEGYHAEENHLSSSSFKLLLDDPEKFYQFKVLKEPHEHKSTPTFDEGSYIHTLILEPELAATEYAIFPELRKSGPAWEEFKIKNEGKTLLSRAQELRVLTWYEAYNKCEKAKGLVAGTQSEVSLFTTLCDIPVKVRADALHLDRGYIIDVKSTSFGLSKTDFQLTMEKFDYKLSAAMYLRCFEMYLKQSLDFYFIVLGKKELGCSVFKLSKDSRAQGLDRLYTAIDAFKNKKYLTKEPKSITIKTSDGIEEV
jgi:hypothetical protein